MREVKQQIKIVRCYVRSVIEENLGNKIMIKIVSEYIRRALNCNFINQQDFPKKQGVYLIFQKNKIIYVGESVN